MAFSLFGSIPAIFEDAGRRQLNESGAPARPKSIVNYVTVVSEGGQQPSIFKDDGYIPKQLEDTRFELLWKSHYSQVQLRG